MPVALHIPTQLEQVLRPDHVIAEGLLNPRGVCLQGDGSLLLAEAGSGLPDQPFSGRISRLRPIRASRAPTCRPRSWPRVFVR